MELTEFSGVGPLMWCAGLCMVSTVTIKNGEDNDYDEV